MEQGSSSRPVPATEDVMEQLNREVLEEGCELVSSSFIGDLLNLNPVSLTSGSRMRSV